MRGLSQIRDQLVAHGGGNHRWARLIAKVFHADPLTCRKCGAKLLVRAAAGNVYYLTREAGKNVLFETLDREGKDAWVHRSCVAR